MIEAAEAFMAQGGRQGDMILYGEDLDPTACNITYTQFSLLGYPAVVTHQDTLALKLYEGPWYTIGYFAHGMPMRLLAQHMDEGIAKTHKEDKEAPLSPSADKPIEVNVRDLVQEEFNF